MKRTHTVVLLGMMAVALLFASCDTLFTNQFQTWGLGQVTSESLLDAAVNADVADIIAQSGLEEGGVSDSFLAAATVDEETADAVIAALEDAIADPESTPEEVQAATVLIIEIELEISGAGDLIDNMLNAFGQIDFDNFDPIGNPDDLAALLASLFPPRDSKVLLPEGWTSEDVAYVIDELAALESDFEAVAAQLLLQGEYMIPGIDAGWLAQVGTVVNLLNRIEMVDPAESIGHAIARVIETPENASSIIIISDTLIDDVLADEDLALLFDATGLDLAALVAMFQG